MTTLYTLADRLAELVYEPKMERLQYCTTFAQPINLNAFTAEEREWIEAANKDVALSGGEGEK